MSMNELANQDFERAVVRAFWRKIFARLKGEKNDLLPFDEVRERLPIRGQHYIGLKQVSVDKIIGSMGRYQDFDRVFLPIQVRTKDRWVSIDKAHYAQVILPPVDLYKIGDVYFVKDGNHRVSVARERGQEFMDAFVIELDTPVILSADLKMDDLEGKRAQGDFLLKTGLDRLRPQAVIDASQSEFYDRLLEHIKVHRWYLGEKRQTEVPYEEAVASWYDQVYQPIIDLISEQDLCRLFPGASETDLYLWIAEYQGLVRIAGLGEQVDRDQARTQAALQLLQNYPDSPVKKLVSIMGHSIWLDKLLLQQERTRFLEETQVLAIRPDARIETTVPGMYDLLRDHINVHKWYLGEQRYSDVPYQEAVVSWYDNVYMPIVEIIREQAVLEEFPGRTETDLYLWVIDRWEWLRERYGSQVLVETAAEQLADDQAGPVRKVMRAIKKVANKQEPPSDK